LYGDRGGVAQACQRANVQDLPASPAACSPGARTGRGSPKLPILTRYRDGSDLSRFGGVPVRVVEAEITVATTAGRATGLYRLITTLLDPHRHPALDIVKLTTNAGRSKPPTSS
jgi:hypothetical protein